jgi:curved DNA-binding protein CbpA
MDLYEILEIKPTASEIEIKKTYLRLVKQYHPDRNKLPNAAEHFQKIQSAYEILINPTTRQEYQKMNPSAKFSFVEILEKIIKENINIDELKKFGINLEKTDFDYIQTNFENFIRALNVGELLSFFTKGIVPKKDINNIINCSESDVEIYEETSAEYYYHLPIYYQKINKLDIKLDLTIKIGDITNNNKRKIRIKRNLEDEEITSTFVINLSKPYIIFIGAGDMDNGDYGNLIVKLNLPNNLLWDENIILIEQSMTLYELIYGLDIKLDIGENKHIDIQNWVPSRDGYLIDISNYNTNTNSPEKQNQLFIKVPLSLGIKLFLDYENTSEKEQLLKQYFS